MEFDFALSSNLDAKPLCLGLCETRERVTTTEGQQATPRKQGVTTKEPKLLCCCLFIMSLLMFPSLFSL